MGREIRKVPPNFEHPTHKDFSHWIGGYHPMFNENFDEVFANWLENFDRIKNGNLTENEKEWYPHGLADWLVDEPPPDPLYYRHYKDEEATWYQYYETTSEGTPLTPPFSTLEELAKYLEENGTFQDQKDGKKGWGKEDTKHIILAYKDLGI